MELKEALLRLKKGETVAFDTVFRQCAPRLYYFVDSYFGNKVEAEEVVQETFIKVWQYREQIDENQSFNTFIITIAKHMVYNKLKHRMVEKRYVDSVWHTSSNSDGVDDELDRKHLREHLEAAISLLPPQQRDILLLKNKGYNNEEIAKNLKISKRTVETHISRAFRLLRTQLKA